MKKVASVLAIVLISLVLGQSFSAAQYQNYTYSSDGIAQAEPQSYIPVETVTGLQLGIGSFRSPKDVFVSEKKEIYVADTGNSRIVILDERYQLVKVISEFDNNGVKDHFSEPEGLFVDSNNIIYIADTGNARIVALDENEKLYKILGAPESSLIDGELIYAPISVCVDSAQRVYCVSRNVNQGMIELSSEGEFWGFFGAVQTVPDFALILQKALATKTQKEQMQLTVPTEYSSCDIDATDFIYGTVSTVGTTNVDPEMFVHRLNPLGNDILKRNGFFAPMGDVNYRIDIAEDKYEPSQLTDICVRDSGIYSVLDSRMGRIFTYNSNGDLMYIFGANGNALGQFGSAEGIDSFGDNYVIVDSKYNWISIFKPTQYGNMVTEAVRAYSHRDYEKADELWNEILNYTAKSELAFKGVGLSLIKKGKYKEAMLYLRLANDKKNYSVALNNYRIQFVDKYFNVIIIGVSAALFLLTVPLRIYRWYRKRKGAAKQ